MKQPSLIAAPLLLMLSPTWALAEDAQFEKALDELIPKLSAEKIPDRHGAQRTLLEISLQLGAPGKEQQRADACRIMAEKLATDLAAPTRVWLLKQLEYIGRGECVDAVAELLDDDDRLIRDAARRALANNPEAAAGDKLLANLKNTQDADFKAAIIHALGFRASADSVDALSGELANNNQMVAIAAARALGKIATPKVAKALAAARESASGELKVWIGDSYLLCADNLLKQGKTREAAAIYKELSHSQENSPLRLAALQGLLKISQAGKTGGEQPGGE